MKTRNKTRKALLASIASLVVLSGCGAFDIDYEGEGDEFTVRGEISDIGGRSIKVELDDILAAKGKAKGWFTEGDNSRVHNNYKNDWCNIHEVDFDILDEEGKREELSDLRTGDYVEIEGRVRESKESCGKTPIWSSRPVFDEVREIRR